MRDITDVYFDGLKKWISAMNEHTRIKQASCFFTLHDRDKHVAERINERQIDILGLLKDGYRIISDNLAMLVYEVYSNRTQIVIKTTYGHLVFRVSYLRERECYRLNLCTATPCRYSHDRDFILSYKENA